jgi:hypothetical protein
MGGIYGMFINWCTQNATPKIAISNVLCHNLQHLKSRLITPMTNPKQLAYGLDAPFNADPVDTPYVRYGQGITSIQFPTDDGQWGRVTFEGLDSIKVSRGEHSPFPSSPSEKSKFYWVTTISNSVWLRERYEYEKKCYGSSYNFGGDVDEMLSEYSHYVFSFHDQFVEVLAAGIWFEASQTMLGDSEIQPNHPLSGLGHIETSEQFEGSGVVCHVRRNPLSNAELEHRARLCSQPLLEIGAELDGSIGTQWTLTRRVLNGVGKTYLRNSFGSCEAFFEDIPELSAVRPVIDKWLAEVRERRKNMGKA